MSREQTHQLSQRWLGNLTSHCQQCTPLTAQQLYDNIKHAKSTANSLDNIYIDDLKIPPLLAIAWLANLLSYVELGAPWPQPTLCARAAYLTKTVEQTGNPLDNRVLAILSVLYRRWAATRLGDLTDWSRQWGLEEVFAGLPQRGAEDATYLTALDFELGRLGNQVVIGAATDLWKCFDRVNWQAIENPCASGVRRSS